MSHNNNSSNTMIANNNNNNNNNSGSGDRDRESDSESESDIVETLRRSFTDLFGFDELVLPALQTLLREPPRSLVINTKQIVVQNGINKALFQTKEEKKVLDMMRIVLCCAYVLVHEKQKQSQALSQAQSFSSCELSEQQFLDKYLKDEKFQAVYHPETHADKKDLPLMASFCKYMRLALELLPENRNKGLAIQIAGRLEGSKEIYVLGSGQRDSSTRREIIYHAESGIPFPTKPSAQRPAAGDSDNDATIVDSSVPVQRASSQIEQSKRKRDSLVEVEPVRASKASRPTLSRESTLSEWAVDECNKHSLQFQPQSGYYVDYECDVLLNEYHVGFTETAQAIVF